MDNSIAQVYERITEKARKEADWLRENAKRASSDEYRRQLLCAAAAIEALAIKFRI